MESSYPPDNALPRYSVNLDLPQSERWADLGKQYGAAMIVMIEEVLQHLEKGPLKIRIPELIKKIDDNADMILGRMQVRRAMILCYRLRDLFCVNLGISIHAFLVLCIGCL